MVTMADMNLIADLSQAKGAPSPGGGAGKPMKGNKPEEQPPAPQGPMDMRTGLPGNNALTPGNTINDPSVKGAGATDLATPDTSAGLGAMGSQDKLNMIAKLYGGGMGMA